MKGRKIELLMLEEQVNDLEKNPILLSSGSKTLSGIIGF